MKKQHGFVSVFMLFILAIWVVIIGSWIVNLNKLIDCDFQAPYKCEAVHGIGIVPVISVVTAWVDNIGK